MVVVVTLLAPEVDGVMAVDRRASAFVELPATRWTEFAIVQLDGLVRCASRHVRMDAGEKGALTSVDVETVSAATDSQDSANVCLASLEMTVTNVIF